MAIHEGEKRENSLELGFKGDPWGSAIIMFILKKNDEQKIITQNDTILTISY